MIRTRTAEDYQTPESGNTTGRPKAGGISDPDEIEAFRARGDPAGGPIAALQHLPRPIGLRLPRPDCEQDTDEVAHHVVQEAVRHHVEPHPCATLGDIERVDRADRAPRLARARAVGAEVVGTDQPFGRGAKPGEVEWPAVAGDPAVKDRGPIRPVEQQVPVVPPAGGEPGVKVSGDLPGFDDRHPGAEVRVRSAPPPILAADRGGVEVHHLAERVNPGIGAPRAHDPHGLVRDPGKGPLDGGLDGLAVRLAFPPAKRPSVVLDDEGDTARGHPGAGVRGPAFTAAGPARRRATDRPPRRGRPGRSGTRSDLRASVEIEIVQFPDLDLTVGSGWTPGVLPRLRPQPGRLFRRPVPVFVPVQIHADGKIGVSGDSRRLHRPVRNQGP